MKFTLMLFLILFSCKSTSTIDENIKTIKAQLNDYGKLSEDAQTLSKISGIKPKYFTSALYVTIDSTTKAIPIDDKTFNPEFFIGYEYKNAMVKILVQSYYHSGKEIWVAKKIALVDSGFL